MRKIILLLLFMLFTGVSPAFTHAQNTSRSITIIPPRVEKEIMPGSRIEGVLKVVNRSDGPLTFNVDAHDYVVNDKSGTPRLLTDGNLSNKFSAAAWIKVDPDQFTINPGQRQEISYAVEVPSNARPGGHYAAVVYKPSDIIPVEGSATGVQTQIGTLFYLNVKGVIKEDAVVSLFEAKEFSEYGPVKIVTEILNKGDLHIKPHGTLTVKNMLGQVVYTKTIEDRNIFPEESLVYESNVGQKWMLGPYSSTFNATYGRDNNLPLTATVTFVVLPWKATTVAILLLIIIFLSILAVERRKKE